MGWHRRPNHSSWLFLGLLIIAVFGVILLLLPYFLQVKKVECYSQFGLCPDEVSAATTKFIGAPLLFHIKPGEVKAKLSSFPDVKSVSLHPRLPSTLVINIQIRRPLGLVRSDTSTTSLVADTDGSVYKSGNLSSGLPTLIRSQSDLDRPLASAELQALNMLSSFSLLTAFPITGRLQDQILSVNYSSTTQVILALDKLPSGWLNTLQSILARSKMDGKVPAFIDLRYSDPVLTF